MTLLLFLSACLLNVFICEESHSQGCQSGRSFDFIFPDRSFTEAPVNGKIVMPDIISANVTDVGLGVSDIEFSVSDNPAFFPVLFLGHGSVSPGSGTRTVGAYPRIAKVHIPKNTFFPGQNLYFRASPRCLIGDINGDGQITIIDSLLLARYLAGLITLTPEQLARADLDGSGTVSIADALLISQTAAGLRAIRRIVGRSMEVRASVVSDLAAKLENSSGYFVSPNITPSSDGISPFTVIGWFDSRTVVLPSGFQYREVKPQIMGLDADTLNSVNQSTLDISSITVAAINQGTFYTRIINTGREVAVLGYAFDSYLGAPIPFNNQMPLLVVFNNNGTIRSSTVLTMNSSFPFFWSAEPSALVQTGPDELIATFNVIRECINPGCLVPPYSIVLQKFSISTGALIGQPVELYPPGRDDSIEAFDAVLMPNGYLYIAASDLSPTLPPGGANTIISIDPRSMNVVWNTTLSGVLAWRHSTLTSTGNLLYYLTRDLELFEFETLGNGNATQRRHLALPFQLPVPPSSTLSEGIQVLAIDDELLIFGHGGGMVYNDSYFLIRLDRKTWQLKFPANESQLILYDTASLPGTLYPTCGDLVYDEKSRGITMAFCSNIGPSTNNWVVIARCNRNLQCEDGALNSYVLNLSLPPPPYTPVSEQQLPLSQRIRNWTNVDYTLVPQQSTTLVVTPY